MKFRTRIGKGVLGKDGKPFAPRTVSATSGDWRTPVSFEVASLIKLLLDPGIDVIDVIDEYNVQTTFTRIK